MWLLPARVWVGEDLGAGMWLLLARVWLYEDLGAGMRLLFARVWVGEELDGWIDWRRLANLPTRRLEASEVLRPVSQRGRTVPSVPVGYWWQASSPLRNGRGGGCVSLIKDALHISVYLSIYTYLYLYLYASIYMSGPENCVGQPSVREPL